MPWQNLYATDKEFTGTCMKMGWKKFPTIFTHQGLKMSYVSEETFRKIGEE